MLILLACPVVYVQVRDFLAESRFGQSDQSPHCPLLLLFVRLNPLFPLSPPRPEYLIPPDLPFVPLPFLFPLSLLITCQSTFLIAHQVGFRHFRKRIRLGGCERIVGEPQVGFTFKLAVFGPSCSPRCYLLKSFFLAAAVRLACLAENFPVVEGLFGIEFLGAGSQRHVHSRDIAFSTSSKLKVLDVGN